VLAIRQGHDPPPLKWSALRYVLERMEKADGKKAVQA